MRSVSLRAATSARKVAIPRTRRSRASAPLTADALAKIDAYWRAANYLSVGQIYLYDNPLLEVPLTLEHIKPRLLGHWGTTPGLNFIYTHLNRVIVAQDLSVLFVTGPGHGGPALVASTYLEGTYSELYPEVTQDKDGLRRLFRQFSFPGGIPSHVAAETPGSIHEGGELGYALAHAYGAAFDNPDLIVACVIGDGEAETGPLAASWQANKFLNPERDGAVLPILHLNGYKIAGPTVLARIPRAELGRIWKASATSRISSRATSPRRCTGKMAATLDRVIADIRTIQRDARDARIPQAPALADDRARLAEGLDRAETRRRQEGGGNVSRPPGAAGGNARAPEARRAARTLDEELSAARAVRCERAAQARARRARAEGRPADGREPAGERRAVAARPAAAGLPPLRDRGPAPRRLSTAEATRAQGEFLRDVMRGNARTRNFRVFSPDELASNRWNAVFEATDRCSVGRGPP